MEQNEVVSEEMPVENKKPMMSLRNLTILVVVAALGILGYIYKGVFVVATVNGNPISRLSLINKLEKTSGKQTLDGLITQKLVTTELDKANIVVTADEVKAELTKIEGQITGQGGTLDEVLASQGMTRADLMEQLTVNLRVEKFLADKIQVSDEDVNKYIKDNKLKVPWGKEAEYKAQVAEQLKSSKLSTAAKEWIGTLRTSANINYFVNF